MSLNTKKTKAANSLLPFGAAAGVLITIGLITWYSQDSRLVQPQMVDPLQAEQDRVDSMLSKINNDIAKVTQLNSKKQKAKTINQ